MPFITTPLLKQQNETAEKVYPQELTLSIQLSSPAERKHLALVNPYVGIRIVRTVARPHPYRNQSGHLPD
jgi:predicted metalloenzyme YecM